METTTATTTTTVDEEVPPPSAWTLEDATAAYFQSTAVLAGLGTATLAIAYQFTLFIAMFAMRYAPELNQSVLARAGFLFGSMPVFALGALNVAFATLCFVLWLLPSGYRVLVVQQVCKRTAKTMARWKTECCSCVSGRDSWCGRRRAPEPETETETETVSKSEPASATESSTTASTSTSSSVAVIAEAATAATALPPRRRFVPNFYNHPPSHGSVLE